MILLLNDVNSGFLGGFNKKLTENNKKSILTTYNFDGNFLFISCIWRRKVKLTSGQIKRRRFPICKKSFYLGKNILTLTVILPDFRLEIFLEYNAKKVN